METEIDEVAIGALYERYGHAIYRRCLRLVGSDEDAQELLQEVFCQFWRGRKKFRGDSSTFTFLYRIATNLSIDRLRRRTTAGVSVSLDESRDGQDTRGPGERVEAATQLAALTEGLDAETITIAVMSHVDGLTQDEIAESLDLSRRTIGKKLKKFLEHTRRRASGAA